MTVHTTDSERVNALFSQEKWDEARQFIEAELSRLTETSPARHWWLARLSTTHYEQGNYELALQFSRRAVRLTPDCPLALWDFAGSLDMLGQDRKAISIYSRILRYGTKPSSADGCWEGDKRKRALLADCHYRLGHLYHGLGEQIPALRHAGLFLRDLANGAESLYESSGVDPILRATSRQKRIA